MSANRARTTVAAGVFAFCLVGVLGVALMGGVSADESVAASGATIDPDASTNANVSEEAYVEPAPEVGDPYYEASDGNWVSYINPRDEYRSPYLGDGSGKIGVTLLNEAGEPIVGETVPNTTVTIDTGDELNWHSHANPVTVQYPLTDHYDRPLDSDQFGTTDDLPQGDGYMDTHSIEMHGQPEDATIEYGEAQIEGEHADKIEVVGYVEQTHDTWDTSVDPIEDAESYEEVGGEWTFKPDGSHGQVIVVLQLDADETGVGDGDSNEENGDSDDSDGTDHSSDSDDGSASADGTSDEDDADDGDELPGFGIPAVIVALAIAALLGVRRRST
ncbi:PGF-CTERM sorting domain-containing protein [Natronorubrum sp. DTA28]|uniref:PGF-CTERM sorting domain-containing protein n=1 Tax=Natronorubrum sp. DTA28 TaxID=3447019 RepID=UPI003F83D280